MTQGRLVPIVLILMYLTYPTIAQPEVYDDTYYLTSDLKEWDWEKVNWESEALQKRINTDEHARIAYMRHFGLESVNLNPGNQHLQYGIAGITHPHGIFYPLALIPPNTNILAAEDGLIIMPKRDYETDQNNKVIMFDRIPSTGITVDTKGTMVKLPDGTEFNGKLSFKQGNPYIKPGDEAFIFGLKIPRQQTEVNLFSDGEDHPFDSFISADVKGRTVLIKNARAVLVDATYVHAEEKDVFEINLGKGASARISNREETGLHPSVMVDCPKESQICGSIQNGKLAVDIRDFNIRQFNKYRETDVGSVPIELWGKETSSLTHNLILLIDNRNQAYLAQGYEDKELKVRKKVDFNLEIENLVEQNDELPFGTNIRARYIEQGPNPHDLLLYGLRERSRNMKVVGKMDLHRHVDEKNVEGMLGQLRDQGYTVAGITNHNDIAIFNSKFLGKDGNLRSLTDFAREDFGVEVVPGVEITTPENSHFLMYFENVEKLNRFMDILEVNHHDPIIPVKTPTEEIIRHAEELEGAITVAHPNEDKLNFLREQYGDKYGRIISRVNGVEGINGFQKHDANAQTIRQAIVEGLYPNKHIFGSSDDHHPNFAFSTSFTQIYSPSESERITAARLVEQMRKDSDESDLLFYPRGKSIEDYEEQSILSAKEHLNTVNWDFYQNNPDAFIQSPWITQYNALAENEKREAEAYYADRAAISREEARRRMEAAVFARNNPSVYEMMKTVGGAWSASRQAITSTSEEVMGSASHFANYVAEYLTN